MIGLLDYLYLFHLVLQAFLAEQLSPTKARRCVALFFLPGAFRFLSGRLCHKSSTWLIAHISYSRNRNYKSEAREGVEVVGEVP